MSAEYLETLGDREERDVAVNRGRSADRGDGCGSASEGREDRRGERCDAVHGEAEPQVQCVAEKVTGKCFASENAAGNAKDGGEAEAEAGAADLTRIPEKVRASVVSKVGEYDARRLRSQREIIRDVMLSAGECETWLTLGELRALTRYGETSISAQLRHLRKEENGGYDLVKRHRDGSSPARPGVDGRSECVGNIGWLVGCAKAMREEGVRVDWAPRRNDARAAR